jgi:hypothetical protein
MVAFDTRVTAHVEPGEGRAHFLRVMAELVGLFDPVDEDLTDLTDAELVEAVAAHMRHQEGVSLRRATEGSLPYVEALAAEAKRVLGNPRPRDRELAQDPALAELRRYCRERGVPVPYRSDAGFGEKAEGLAEALEKVRRSRARVHSLLLVSDLESLGQWETIERSLRRLGPGRRPLLVIVPFAPLFIAPTTDQRDKKVRALLELEERRRLDNARRRFARHGGRIIVASPEEMPALLYARAAGRI